MNQHRDILDVSSEDVEPDWARRAEIAERVVEQSGQSLATREAQDNVPAERREMSIMEMVGRALEMQVPAEVFKQMMDLRDREEGRLARMAFTQAVAKAKAEIRPILKTREVDYTPQGKPRVNYRHEDLAGIEEQIAPILTKNGLSYRFDSDNGVDRPITVTCILEHVDGHSTRTALSGPADSGAGKNSLQAIASTATYLQRYTLKLALGLSVSHDDDGRKADQTVEDAKTISKEQIATLQTLLDETNSDIKKFCEMGEIGSLAEMRASQFDNAKRLLEQKKARLEKAPAA